MLSLKEIVFDFENNYLFALGGSALGCLLLVGLVWKAFKVKMKTAQNERLRQNLLELYHLA